MRQGKSLFDQGWDDMLKNAREYDRREALFRKYSKSGHVTHYADGTQDSEYGDSFIPVCTNRPLEMAEFRVTYCKGDVTCKRCLLKL